MITALDQAAVDRFVRACHGDFETVKTMLAEQPALANSAASWDETALGAAAHTGQTAIAEYLIERGAPIDICTAAMLGRLETVEAMLRDDPALAQATGAHGIPVLFYPMLRGHRAVAEVLLAHGASVNAGDGAMTPLHGAALTGQVEMAAWLLARGANVNAPDFNGHTPLKAALGANRTEVADLLRARGGSE